MKETKESYMIENVVGEKKKIGEWFFSDKISSNSNNNNLKKKG